MKKILVAVAWPYVNGDLHPGHLAGYLLPADIFARFHRIVGNDVLMVSGSDCHGTPITIQADKENLSPKDIVNKYHQKDLTLFKKLNLSYNIYTKTTTENHKNIVQDIFFELLKNGYIYKSKMQQYFSLNESKFLPDRYVEGECPFCHAQDQRSDQCEVCGQWIPDGQLISPKSKLTGSPVEMRDTEHYFLNFELLQNDLRNFVESRQNIWKEWVYKESIGWLDGGLKSRAITRDLDWGVDLPIDKILTLSKDKILESFEGKKIYVWFEAVIGYLSASIEWSKLSKKNLEVSSFEYIHQISNISIDWEDWWFGEDSEHYYFMGQDNLVFHTLMWPGQLIGCRRNYTLPYNVCVNKFLNFEGQKFSKSRNHIVDTNKLIDIYGLDEVRFYISSILPENKESDFRWDDLISKINNELVGILGNFINRTLIFINRFFGSDFELSENDLSADVNAFINKSLIEFKNNLIQCNFVLSLKTILDLARFGNKYFDESKVWEIVKTDKDRSKYYLGNLMQLVYILSIVIYPFMPNSSDKLRKMIGYPNIVFEKNKNWLEYIPVLKFKITKDIHPLFKKVEKIEKC